MKRASYSMKGDHFEVGYLWGCQKVTLLGAIVKLVQFWRKNGNGPDVYDEITFRLDRKVRRMGI